MKEKYEWTRNKSGDEYHLKINGCLIHEGGDTSCAFIVINALGDLVSYIDRGHQHEGCSCKSIVNSKMDELKKVGINKATKLHKNFVIVWT